MLKSHEKFHSANGKRLVLIVDDEVINQEILKNVIQDEYEVLLASDGLEAMRLVKAYQEVLSLVLLDLLMPGINGLELLQWMKEDPEIWNIPVIVMTSDQEAEVESLSMGAIDFIPKPYPRAGVILARILRTIELSEDRQIINSTERDALTGLYNRAYFYRYAEQYDQHHKEMEMDAIVVDVNHFHMINERFGTHYGDGVLRRIGETLRERVSESGGIVCRREADTFLIYCPHGQDYQELLEEASIGATGEDAANNRVRLRMGVYERVDKSLNIERRFDRAKMAADTVRNSFAKTIGIYDSALHEEELFAEQLIEDFPAAIQEKQFKVYYQPKFDIRTEIPVLASAEALVRWQHPGLGMISPGVFIPLFEDNGLIQTLDNYVWRAAAEQIRDWRERFDITVPVSVNVSRIDMYDPRMIDTFQEILSENGLSASEFLLEITESAYTQDSTQIIDTVHRLRTLGFQIEMDDFGTGYSSLNMISTLPIDALKLDMQFIRNAFNERKDTHMLEVIIDIADHLSVPVIAEGVETEEQLQALKEMGCDLVQGYYFSRPLPPEEYERFVQERKQLDEPVGRITRTASRLVSRKESTFGTIAHALSSGFERIYFVDTENNHYIQFSSRGRYEDLQIEDSGSDFFTQIMQIIPRLICQEDQTRVSLSLQKETLLTHLKGSQPFSMTYRMMIRGALVFYNLKAVKVKTGDDHHIVIGISNVDAEIRQVGQTDVPNLLDFNSLAQALSSEMESIYYVDTRSDTYFEYETGDFKALQLKQSGTDFFRECQENIREAVYPDDQEKVASALEKENLLSVLKERYTFSMLYRLMIDGEPAFYRLKAVLTGGAEQNHIIIGTSNVESQITEAEKQRLLLEERVTFSRIAEALSQDYISIYYVDSETDQFIEFSSIEDYQSLNIEKGGKDFFQASRRNAVRVIYPEDQNLFLQVFTKENILRELEKNRTFSVTYRLLFDGVPTYVYLKATRMEDKNDKHIVIGVSNVDEQIRREQEREQAVNAVNRDALTGVKSKHAYTETEREIDRDIQAGTADPFAVVVCDVNGLKQINDTLGHKAGDQLIKDACKVICNVFKHSPVYRIGGDEFVAILRGGDYAVRQELMEQFCQKNRTSVQGQNQRIAGGLSVYRPDEDGALAAVFERADARMYENKRKLKGLS